MAGPGTEAEARAMAAASCPAARAAAVDRWGVAKNPHDEPMSARTPTPADSSSVRASTTWLSTFRDSARVTVTRASA
ncbi:MAG TPA: hypothetical protein VFO65_10230 [Acidimicrobiales bacterium]|nr:hypothetical protein [Acidimicrobiales bacterium]